MVPHLKFLRVDNLFPGVNSIQGIRSYTNHVYWSKDREETCSRMGNSTYIKHRTFDTENAGMNCEQDRTFLPSLTKYYLGAGKWGIPTLSEGYKPDRLKKLGQLTSLRYKDFSRAHSNGEWTSYLKATDVGTDKNDYLRGELNETLNLNGMTNRTEKEMRQTRSYHLHLGIIRRPMFYRIKTYYSAKVYYDMYVIEQTMKTAKMYVIKTFEFRTQHYTPVEEAIFDMEKVKDTWMVKGQSSYEITSIKAWSGVELWIHSLRILAELFIVYNVFKSFTSTTVHLGDMPLLAAKNAGKGEENQPLSTDTVVWKFLDYKKVLSEKWSQITGLSGWVQGRAFQVKKRGEADLHLPNNWAYSFLVVASIATAMDRKIYLAIDDIHRVFYQKKMAMDLGLLASMLGMCQFLMALHVLFGLALHLIVTPLRSIISKFLPSHWYICNKPCTLIIDEFKILSVIYATALTIEVSTWTVVCGLADITECSFFNPGSVITLEMMIPLRMLAIMVGFTVQGLLFAWAATQIIQFALHFRSKRTTMLSCCESMGYIFVPASYFLRGLTGPKTSFLDLMVVTNSNWTIRFTGYTQVPKSIVWTLCSQSTDELCACYTTFFARNTKLITSGVKTSSKTYVSSATTRTEKSENASSRGAPSYNVEINSDARPYGIAFYENKVTREVTPLLIVDNGAFIMNWLRVLRWIKGEIKIELDN